MRILNNLTCLAVIQSCKCTKFKQNTLTEQLQDTFDMKKVVVQQLRALCEWLKVIDFTSTGEEGDQTF